MVDTTLILRKLSELETYLSQVVEYKDITLEAYQRDWKTQRIVERTLQMMIETCVDIAGHIISDGEYRVPKTYADAFGVLQENELVDKELADRLQSMAKFRNIVVHNYDKVDAEIVIGILRKRLDDFSCYKDAIVKTIKKFEL